MPDIPGNLTSSALMTVGTPFSSQFGDPGDPEPFINDVDWIGIDLVYGQTYLFVMNNVLSGAGTDPSNLRLVDSAGNIDNRYDRFGTRFFQVTARYTGRHYLAAAQGNTVLTGNYTINAFRTDDDTRGIAPILKINAGYMLEHELSSSADTDTFDLVLPAGRTWQIHVRGVSSGSGTLADPRLTLRKNGVLIGSDNDSGAGTDAYYQYINFAPETIQLTVAGTGSGSYRVIATVPDLSAPDHTTTSFMPFSGNLASVTGYIGHPKDVDWFRVNLNEDDVVKVTLRGTSAADFLATPQVVMRSSTGQILGSATVSNTSADIFASFFAVIPSTGGYYAIARTALENYVGEYQISVEKVRAPFAGSFRFGQGQTNRIPLTSNLVVNLSELIDLNGIQAESFQIWSEIPLKEGGVNRAAQTLFTIAGNALNNWTLDSAPDTEAQLYIRGFAGRTWSQWLKFPVANLVAPANLVSANTWPGSGPITFRFVTSLPDYFTPGEFGTFSAISPSSGAGNWFLTIATELERIIGREVILATGGAPADINLFFGTGFASAAQTFSPGPGRGGDIILNSGVISGAINDLQRFHITRALGNALGLNFVASASHLRTVMGDQLHAGGATFPARFGVDDYKALAEKYGSVVYDPERTVPGPFVATISAAPGILTITETSTAISVADGFNGDVLIDLRDGNRSGLRQANPAGREIFIAPGIAVYNATSGNGNDDLRGNDLDNVLRGGNGDNFFTGHGGKDRFFGGVNADVYIHNFGDGEDVIGDTGGEDTLCFFGKGNFRLDDLDANYVFRRTGNFLDLSPNLDGGLREGFVRIDNGAGGAGRIEKLELWHENTLTSRISLVSIWNQLANGQERRFLLSGGSDQYGLLAAPV
jgi:hypothetical protein